MEETNRSTSEFAAAIKNYSQISLEVDALKSLGNADAHKIMNKSIENRNVAIEHEAFRRLKSFEAEENTTKSKESQQTHRTLEKLFREKVELEFDKGVEELKSKLRGNSTIYENNVEKQSEADEGEKVEKKKSESSDVESENESSEVENENESSDEVSDSGNSDEGNTEDESSDNESTDDEDSSDEDEDEEENGNSTENENTEDENTDHEAAPEKIDDSNKQLNSEV